MHKACFKQLIITFLPIIFLLFSCGSEKQKVVRPATLISKDSMPLILTDIHIIEAVLSGKQMDKNLTAGLSQIYYDSLFAKYNVTRTVFDSSLYYYSQDPKTLNAIYDIVISNLMKIEADSIRADSTAIIETNDSLASP
ncbi:MAG: DUF4296 domain-containing protein [Bacteroidales bacterium]